MKKILPYILPILVLAGCASDTEQNGLNQIEQFYGCNVSFQKSVVSSTDEGTKKSFEIELSGGSALDELPPKLVASNATLMMYNSMDGEGKSNYTHIKSRIVQNIDNTTTTTETEFPVADLHAVSVKQYLFSRCAELVINKDYDALIELFAPVISESFSKEQFVEYLGNSSVSQGEITGVEMKGFEIVDWGYEGETFKLIRMIGTIHRTNQSKDYILAVKKDESDPQIYGINL